MRKIASIALISLILFNLLGYYGLFFGLQYNNDSTITQLSQQENLGNANTITLKIPMALPYGADQKSFEYTDGKFEHNGEFYRMVRQRFESDTLYVVCLRDHGSEKISDAFSDFVKTFTDKATHSSSGKHILPSFIKEYLGGSHAAMNVAISGWATEVSPTTAIKIFIPAYTASIVHPPERA